MVNNLKKNGNKLVVIASNSLNNVSNRGYRIDLTDLWVCANSLMAYMDQFYIYVSLKFSNYDPCLTS